MKRWSALLLLVLLPLTMAPRTSLTLFDGWRGFVLTQHEATKPEGVAVIVFTVIAPTDFSGDQLITVAMSQAWEPVAMSPDCSESGSLATCTLTDVAGGEERRLRIVARSPTGNPLGFQITNGALE